MNIVSKGVIHILYIGQDEDRAYVRKSLGRKFSVDMYSGEEDALKVLSANEVHVVICGSGTQEVIHTLAEEYPLIPCIAIMESTNVRQIQKIFHSGNVFRIFGKPLLPEELRTSVREAYDIYMKRLQNADQVSNFTQSRKAEADSTRKIKKPSEGIEYTQKRGSAYFTGKPKKAKIMEESKSAVSLNDTGSAGGKDPFQLVEELDQNLFRNIVNQATVGIALLNQSGRIIEWNDAMEQMLGYSREKVLNRNVWESPFMQKMSVHKSEKTKDLVKSSMMEYLTHPKGPLNIESEFFMPDGQMRFLLLTLFPVQSGANTYHATFVFDHTDRRRTMDDVTNKTIELEELTAEYQSLNEELNTYNEELRTLNESLKAEVKLRSQTEKQLADSEEKFRSFIEESNEAFLIATRNGNILEANKGASGILDIPLEKLRGLNIWEIQKRFLPRGERKGSSRKKMMENIGKLFQREDNRKNLQMEGYYQVNDKVRKYLQGELFLIHSSGGNYIGVIARDLSAKREVDVELENYRLRLEDIVAKRTRELMETEAMLQSLSDNLPGSILFRGYTDHEHGNHLVYANKEMEIVIGKPMEQLRKDISDFYKRFHPDDLASFAKNRDRCIRNGTSLDQQVRFNSISGELRWMQLKVSYRSTENGAVWWDGVAIDVTDQRNSEIIRQQQEIIIRNIQELIAPVTGSRLFETFLRKIEEIVGSYTVFIAEPDPKKGDMMRTLSVCRNGQIIDNFEYKLKDSVSGHVITTGSYAVPKGIAYLFPKDSEIRRDKIESYIGVTLYNSSGQPAGVMVAASRKEMENSAFALQVLQIFSVRVGAELDRMRADKELAEREEKFHTLFESSPNLKLITAMDGTILDANASFLSLTGLEKSEVIGQTIRKLGLWDEEDSRKLNLELRRKKKISNYPAFFRNKKGEKRYVLLSMVPVVINGETCLLSAGVDISDRFIMERKLAESEERFRSILQNLSDSIWIMDRDSTVLYESPSSVQMLGYPEGWLVGRRGIELIHPEDVPQVAHDLGELVIKENLNTPTRFRVRKANGEWIYLEAVGNNMLDHASVRGLILTARNVTERILQDKALRESEEKFKNIFNNSSDAIIISDLNQDIIEVNRVVSKLSGYSRNELIGMKTNQLASNNVKDMITKRLSRLKEGNFLPPVELDFIDRFGNTVPAEMTSQLIDYEGGKAVLTLIRDITERKRIEKMLIDTIIRTEEKERARLAADLHDEVGPLLSSMKMYLASMMETSDLKKVQFISGHLDSLIKESIITVREISNDLSPHVLNSYGLPAAVRNAAETKAGLIQVNLTENLNNQRINPNVEIIFYRIIKELMNNTVKHAEAKTIHIHLKLENRRLGMSYSDDGKGFLWEKEMYSPSGGQGLMNILNRIKSINGQYVIITSPGNGFSFELNASIA